VGRATKLAWPGPARLAGPGQKFNGLGINILVYNTILQLHISISLVSLWLSQKQAASSESRVQTVSSALCMHSAPLCTGLQSFRPRRLNNRYLIICRGWAGPGREMDGRSGPDLKTELIHYALYVEKMRKPLTTS